MILLNSNLDKKVSKSKILRIALIAFFLYTGISCVVMYIDIDQRQQTLNSIKEDLEYQEYLNSQFLSALEYGSDTDYIINIARDKLGFVFPDERVFIDPNRKQ